MDIVIVTAEPLGAYHLVPLHDAMRSATDRGHRFTHLIPYPERVQGTAWENTTASLSILDTADLVVVTGGGFTAWTESIATICTGRSIPFVITELAYGAQPDGISHPSPLAISAMSPSGARNLARYHGVSADTIAVTGTPLLDALPLWEPIDGQVLILSSVDAATRDPDGLLFELAETLRANGSQVTVRCHPREDRSTWAGFELDASATPSQAASNAEIVIGYPGSAHAIVAALGVPVVAVAPTQQMRHDLPPEQADLIPTWITETSQIHLLQDASSTSAEAVFQANGPIGDAAQRVLSFWIESIEQR